VCLEFLAEVHFRHGPHRLQDNSPTGHFAYTGQFAYYLNIIFSPTMPS